MSIMTHTYKLRIQLMCLALLMNGCATRLHVDSAVVTLERHNRGETTESCDGTIYATTSLGEVRTRHVRMAVPAGESRRRYLGTGDHFIDGRYSLSCVTGAP